jgi:threonylcarbamoyladenosine tRNA methylthiotransferase MtaB
MKHIALHTLGCKLNYAETASIGKQFIGDGYTVVGIDDPADIVVINSCSVTARADRECRQLIRRALRHSPDAFVAVVGCYAQVQAAQIATIQGVDLVVGTQEKHSLLRLIQERKKKSHADIHVSCIDELNHCESASSAGFEERTRAFLKVQEGCNYACSYCTIPLARGKSRSVPTRDIILQAREAVEKQYKEIVLTGVNVGDYGSMDGENLLNLLKQLVTIDGLQRIRISSVEPNLLTDELLDFWFNQEKLCNHWHIPLQSGSETILRLMRRRYGPEVYADRIERIISHIPSAGIGADVIIGFPGESKELFKETYTFLEGLPVSYLHVFSYSERPNTSAAVYDQKVDQHVKSERNALLHTLSLHKRQAYYEGFVGKTVPVLFETHRPNGSASGLTEEYVHVHLKTNVNMSNQILQVTITEAYAEKCTGILAEPDLVQTIPIAI